LSKRERLTSVLRRLDRGILSLLFPEGVTCLCCGRSPQGDMDGCICPACALALEELGAKQETLEEQGAYEPVEGLAFVHAAYLYEDPARALIRALKYDRNQSAASPLIAAMALLPSGEEELLVPVPTTRRRLKERGFNQSLLLSQGIGRALGMPVDDVLERVGEQQAQSSLSGRDRLSNLAGCMRAKKRLDGRRILLIDDVYTTGATAREAARALMEAGAFSVGVFAAARAIPETEQPPFLYNARYKRRIEAKDA